MIKFKKVVFYPERAFTLVEFSLPKEGIDPAVISSLKPPEVNPQCGVVLSGRGPVWLYAALVHHYHPTKWVATFDPRLGAVVVESHSPKGPKVGSVIPIS